MVVILTTNITCNSIKEGDVWYFTFGWLCLEHTSGRAARAWLTVMTSSPNNMPRIVIVGGGAGGLSVASRLLNTFKHPDIWVIEPSDTHYYQPYWTLVGGGLVPKEASRKPQAQVMPRGVNWVRGRVASLDAAAKSLRLENGDQMGFDYLVLAPGVQSHWDAVPGLREGLGKNGLCSIYDYQQAEITWQMIQDFGGGNAIFNGAATPVKCGGAPQKIMYLAEEHWREKGVRARSQVKFYTPGTVLFGVKEYADALWKVVHSRGMEVALGRTLTHIDPESRLATFRQVEADGSVQTLSEHYDFMHVVPHMSVPDFLKGSDVLAQDGPLAGWVETDPYTLQHPRFPYVFCLGDAAGLPGHPKTGAAVRKQAPVLVRNLVSQMLREPLQARYDGYTSCPLVTGKDHVILAEFVYGNKVKSSYPSFINSASERKDAMLLKRYGLPKLYWYGMLKGLM